MASEEATIKSIENKPATLCLQGYHLPELKDLHVDDVIELTIKAKVTRKEEGGYGYMGDDEYVDDSLTPTQQKAREARKEAQKKKVSANFVIQDIKSNGVSGPSDQPEVGKAAKYNKLIKEGKSVSQARALAGM